MYEDLTPLQALKELRQNNKDDTHMFDDELLDIIETAIKVTEIFKRNRYEAVQCVAYDTYEEYIEWYINFTKIEPPVTREEYILLRRFFHETR